MHRRGMVMVVVEGWQEVVCPQACARAHGAPVQGRRGRRGHGHKRAPHGGGHAGQGLQSVQVMVWPQAGPGRGCRPSTLLPLEGGVMVGHPCRAGGCSKGINDCGG